MTELEREQMHENAAFWYEKGRRAGIEEAAKIVDNAASFRESLAVLAMKIRLLLEKP